MKKYISVLLIILLVGCQFGVTDVTSQSVSEDLGFRLVIPAE